MLKVSCNTYLSNANLNKNRTLSSYSFVTGNLMYLLPPLFT